jgi:hypothetical protein
MDGYTSQGDRLTGIQHQSRPSIAMQVESEARTREKEGIEEMIDENKKTQ